MSEHNLRDIVSIQPSDIFQQAKLSARDVAEKLDAMESNLEEQRLLSWAEVLADPQGPKARRKYEDLCKAQGKLMTGFMAWRKANPEQEE